MKKGTRLVIGLAVCVASALLMLTGVLDLEVGLVVGTSGMLMMATHAPTRTQGANQDNAS